MILISELSPSSLTPEVSPSPVVAASPNKRHPYRLTLIPGVGLAVTAAAVLTLVVLIFLIRRKSRELEDTGNIDKTSSKTFPPPWHVWKFQEGMTLDLLLSHSRSHSHISDILFIYMFFTFGGWRCRLDLRCRSFVYVP